MGLPNSPWETQWPTGGVSNQCAAERTCTTEHSPANCPSFWPYTWGRKALNPAQLHFLKSSCSRAHSSRSRGQCSEPHSKPCLLLCLLSIKKRDRTEIEQKYLFGISELQCREHGFREQPKFLPFREQKLGGIFETKGNGCIHCLQRIWIGAGHRKLILTGCNWLLRHRLLL